MTDVLYRPGSWCDVCTLGDGSFALVVSDGVSVAFYLHGFTPASRVTLPEPLLFTRCAVDSGVSVKAIGQGNQSGAAYLLSQADYKTIGLTYGAQPVAIDATYAYVVRSAYSYDRIRLDTGEVESLPHGRRGSSQGIRDVHPTNGIAWADDTHVSIAGGIELHDFSDRGPVRVGQCDPPQIAGIYAPSGNPILRFTAISGEAYEPHIVQSGEQYAICARTPHGAAYIEVPPYPQFITSAPVPPVPVPVPTPVPVPVPVPTSMPFDFSSTSIVDSPSDLASWHETATITRVDFSSGKFVVDFDRRTGSNRWPESQKPGDPDTQYTLGLACQVNGHWYASGVVQFWFGRELEAGSGVDEIGATWFYDGRWGPLQGHQPARGETVGIFVGQGNLRGGHGSTPLRERSAVLLLPWGTNYNATSPVPVPVPVPVPTPTPLPTGPTLDAWIHGEFPELVNEFKRKRPELGEPGNEWAAFQTYRRYVEGWSFARLFREV